MDITKQQEAVQILPSILPQIKATQIISPSNNLNTNFLMTMSLLLKNQYIVQKIQMVIVLLVQLKIQVILMNFGSSRMENM